ncbi:ribonuclease Z [Candidatus Pacearchaeota archaeon]|nr:ribonuclease Z [Candidatus Pacearchaeota archaeon]MBD3282868.1 ribonuclease Z [Candidatus Pacearchaeota archaeon]
MIFLKLTNLKNLFKPKYPLLYMAEKIHLTFLGTSSAIPTATRNHTSIFLRYKSENILIDCGEGTQRQLRKAKINPLKINKILITHLHGDHVFGLPGLFETLGLNNYNKTLLIYGPRGIKKFIKNIIRNFIFTEKIKIQVKEVNGKFIDTEDFEITAMKLKHNSICNGYFFKEKNKLRIDKKKLKKLKLPGSSEIAKLKKGKNIKINKKTIKYKDLTYPEKGRKISFILDTQKCQNIKKLIKDSDLAVIESTFLDSLDKNKVKERMHLTARQAAELAKSSKVKKLILTHLSQRYEYKEKLVLKEAKKYFKKTEIAKDLMSITI